MIVLIKALQLILSLSILVVLHEGGHFLFAKLFRVRVEKFFLFFDPWFHLFSTKDKWFVRLFPRAGRTETQYGVGWLPFGGYVKISGMIDESMDTEQMRQPVQPYEFRAKPAWQRLLIMIGGVLVNFLLALFIYIMILFACGEQYISMRDMSLGFRFNEQAHSLGFVDGDQILAADGCDIVRWEGDVYRTLSTAQYVTVLRQGQSVNVNMPGDLNLIEMIQSTPPFVEPFMPCVIDSVLLGSPAEIGGLRSGDKLIAFAGESTPTWTDFDLVRNDCCEALASAVTRADSILLQTVVISYVANGTSDTLTTTLNVGSDFKLGVFMQSLSELYTPTHVDYGFFAAIPAGIRYGIDVLSGYVSDLRYLFTSDGARSVGSFITIGSIFPSTWDWLIFWETTAFLSLMLAFMNILPIPALDGGHVIFLIAEIILRRPPGEKFMERAQTVGMVLLIGLMLLACYNDIVRFIL